MDRDRFQGRIFPGKGETVGREGAGKGRRGRDSRGRGKRGASRPPRTRPRRTVSKIERSLRDVDRAVTTLGRGRVKPGPISLGKTRARVAGVRGVRSVAKILKQTSRPGALKTFTYSVTVKAPDGRIIRSVERQTIPRITKARDPRKIVGQIEREVWNRIGEGLRGEQVETDIRTGKRVKLYASGVRRRLKGNVTFQLEVFAEV